MLRRLLIFLLLLSGNTAFAVHIIGGEMRYAYLGAGTAPNTQRWRITLLLVKGDNTAGAPLDNSYVIGIFNNDNNTKVVGPAANSNWTINITAAGILPLPINQTTCLVNPPVLNYTYARYSIDVDLPINNNGYTAAYQACCRQSGMANISDATSNGYNYLCVIPGTNTLAAGINDSSPAFGLPVNIICYNSPFTLDFSATDTEGDSLVYTFCNPFNGGASNIAAWTDPSAPPYGTLNYNTGFTAQTPLGPNASINPQTGIISGISPAVGSYIVCVCVNEYRNGQLIAVHRKDLMVKVSDCIVTQAVTDPGYTTCDGFSIQFNHNSLGANTVFWNFGDPSTLADTSHLNNPVYNYPDTGQYVVHFWINQGQTCSDSSTLVMGIYPGFFPGFIANGPLCTGVPVQFVDTSRSRYGVIDSWSWNFGDNTTLADTSHLQTPLYTYTNPGNYSITLTVTNNKGCTKNISKNIEVFATPVLSVSGDTTYCGLDTIQLTGTGTGNFLWSPASFIINNTSANPSVFPPVPTAYVATLTSAQGCTKKDTVQVNPIFNLSNNVMALPDTICEGDTVLLTGSSNLNPVTWQWSPAATVLNPIAAITGAVPLSSTTYTLTTSWGNNCRVSSAVHVPVRLLANPNAGNDAFFCINQNAVQLQASGGDSYSWTPTTGLSNPNIPNPIASPAVITDYIVSVGVNGCTKRVNDTVRVTPKNKPTLNVTNDTLICAIDTLQLTASGNAQFYSWMPNYNISNTSIANPLVSPDVPTYYFVTASDTIGCTSKDTVFINVKPDVSLYTGPDTTICKGDSFQMNASSDGTTFIWFPSAGLNTPTIISPRVMPDSTTTYTIIANLGKCQKQGAIQVKVAPLPTANAGPDTTVCMGYSGQIFASGGSVYLWSPNLFLSDAHAANPIVTTPRVSVKYIVTVSDTLGCPRKVKDSVNVFVIVNPRVDAGPRDTSVVAGQPLQLNATGAINYAWTPLRWMISSPLSASPIVKPENNITYHVTGVDQYGCKGSDSINVFVYDVIPSMYVPTAFTPNADGLNDDVKPIMLGMRSLTYFNIYNRFGEMVFSTSKIGKGWDGIYKGKPQDPATFVWTAQGVTFKNEVITKKGYVVLIR